MILNTFNKNDIRCTSFLCCLATIAADDALMLLEDGVYAALPQSGLLQAVPAGVRLFVLQEDLAARGISDKICPDFNRIDYREFVAMTLQFSKTVNWN